jgi:hypothetical protein
VNKWNDYVLGDDYKKGAAKLHPISKECVLEIELVTMLLIEMQGEGTAQEHVRLRSGSSSERL